MAVAASCARGSEGHRERADTLATLGQPNRTGLAVSAREARSARWVTQRLLTLQLSSSKPVAISIDPEGGNVVGARVHAPSAWMRGLQIQVTDPSGQPAAGVTVQEAPYGHLVVMSGLGGEHRTMSVTTREEYTVPVSVLLSVEAQGVELSLAPIPGPAPHTMLEATLSGVRGRESGKYSLRAMARPHGAPPVEVSLKDDGFAPDRTAGDGTFTATAALSVGRYIPVDIVATGPRARHLSTDVVVPNGDVTISGLEGDALVDWDKDGAADLLRVRIRTTVRREGRYRLKADLYGANGAYVTSVATDVALAAGRGDTELTMPVSALFAANTDGPYEVRNVAIYREDPQPTWVARRDRSGSTAAYRLDDISVDKIHMTQPSVLTVDEDRDGQLDRLGFSSFVTVPEAGQYAIEIFVGGPFQGDATVTMEEKIRTLKRGRNLVEVYYPRELVARQGTGRYSLARFRVSSRADPGLAHQPQYMTFWLDRDRWIDAPSDTGGLLRRWRLAAGDVSVGELQVNEEQRLWEAKERLAAGDRHGAITELDRFLADLRASTPDQIPRSTADEFTSYALRLREELSDE